MNYEEREKLDEEKRIQYINKSKFISDKIRSVPKIYSAPDYNISDIEYTIQRFEEVYNLDLLPEFQRGHVWTKEQQVLFIEALIRGAVGTDGRTISFNHPEYQNTKKAHSDLDRMVIIDGLQRLTAIRDFVAGKFKVFVDEFGGDGVDMDFFHGSEFSLGGNTIKIQVYTMQTQREVLDFYISLNSGGTAHSKEEIERVKKMRQDLL